MTAWRFLFLSLVVHLLFWLFLANMPNPTPPSFSPVEIEIIEKRQKTRGKRVVKLPEVDLSPKIKPPKTNNLSEQDRIVPKETRTAQLGFTTANKGSQKPSTKGSKGQPLKSPLGRFNLGWQNRSKIALPRKSSRRGTEVTMSNLDASTMIGAINALNTNAYLYATFINRFADKLGPLWYSNIRQALYYFPGKKKRALVDSTWTTILEIRLDKDGKITKVSLIKPSGEPIFDETPIQALKAAKQFPNPPDGMRNPDGTVTLRFAFELEFI